MKYKKIFLAKTDTIIGIGGPMNAETKSLIFELKQRNETKPLIVMIPNIEEARKFKGWNSNAEKLAKKFWPGQLTIVLDEIALRIPRSSELIDLMNKIGPIYMTSANISGKPNADLEEAIKLFPEITTYYTKTEGSDINSTIIRASDMKVLRSGIVHIIGNEV